MTARARNAWAVVRPGGRLCTGWEKVAKIVERTGRFLTA
jgi:hypothetical protein